MSNKLITLDGLKTYTKYLPLKTFGTNIVPQNMDCSELTEEDKNKSVIIISNQGDSSIFNHLYSNDIIIGPGYTDDMLGLGNRSRVILGVHDIDRCPFTHNSSLIASIGSKQAIDNYNSEFSHIAIYKGDSLNVVNDEQKMALTGISIQPKEQKNSLGQIYFGDGCIGMQTYTENFQGDKFGSYVAWQIIPIPEVSDWVGREEDGSYIDDLHTAVFKFKLSKPIVVTNSDIDLFLDFYISLSMPDIDIITGDFVKLRYQGKINDQQNSIKNNFQQEHYLVSFEKKDIEDNQAIMTAFFIIVHFQHAGVDFVNNSYDLFLDLDYTNSYIFRTDSNYGAMNSLNPPWKEVFEEETTE